MAERFFELSLDMLGTASLEGYCTHLNPAWERTLGWTAEQLMAAPFISFVHPDDVEATLAQAGALAVSDGANVVAFENRYRTAAGDYRWIQWVTVMDGGVLYSVARDVTDSQAAVLERDQDASVMHAVVESVADGLYVADSQGQMTFIDPAGVQLLGYESADELLGLGPHPTFHRKLVGDGAHALADCPLSTVVASGRPARGDDDRFQCKDGTTIPVSFSSAPVDLSGGTGSVVAFRDITELKARELGIRRELEAMSWVGRIRDALDTVRLGPLRPADSRRGDRRDGSARAARADDRSRRRDHRARRVPPGRRAVRPHPGDRSPRLQAGDGLCRRRPPRPDQPVRSVDQRAGALPVRRGAAGGASCRSAARGLRDHGDRADPQRGRRAGVHRERAAAGLCGGARRLRHRLRQLSLPEASSGQRAARSPRSTVTSSRRSWRSRAAWGRRPSPRVSRPSRPTAFIKELGVDYAQRYLFARPAPADDIFNFKREAD
jgi:PAS domain S-box-containing protein